MVNARLLPGAPEIPADFREVTFSVMSPSGDTLAFCCDVYSLFPAASDFAEVAQGNAVERTEDISRLYSFSEVGEYQVCGRYENPWSGPLTFDVGLGDFVEVDVGATLANIESDCVALTIVIDVAQGDVTCDGNVNAVDALMGLRYVAGLGVTQKPGCFEIGSEVASLFGDVDCDDGVDAVDALKVLKFVAALPFTQTEPCPDIGTTLGVGGSPGSALSRAAPLAAAVMGLFVLAGVVRVSTRSRRP